MGESLMERRRVADEVLRDVKAFYEGESRIALRCSLNPKFKTLNSKQYQNSKHKIQNTAF